MTLDRSAWRIDKAGSLDRLRRVDEPLAPPAAGEARLRVEAIGLNFADILACLGLYSATPSGPFIPGLECAGTVEAVGPPAAERESYPPISVGDRVAVVTRFGGYANRLNFDTRYAIPFPAGFSAAEAAAWPVQGLTAWYGLIERGRVQDGECVLVQSAAGGVGLQALDMLAASGARPVAVVGDETKRRVLQDRCGLDPRQVVLRSGAGYPARLDAALQAVGRRGFDVVFDAVLGESFRAAFDRLAPEGRYVLYGAADFMPRGHRPNYAALAWRYLRRARLDPLAMISANTSFIAFNLIWLWEQVGRMPAALDALAGLTTRPPHVGASFPFDRAPEAMRLLQSGRTIGKVVLELPAND